MAKGKKKSAKTWSGKSSPFHVSTPVGGQRPLFGSLPPEQALIEKIEATDIRDVQGQQRLDDLFDAAIAEAHDKALYPTTPGVDYAAELRDRVRKLEELKEGLQAQREIHYRHKGTLPGEGSNPLRGIGQKRGPGAARRNQAEQDAQIARQERKITGPYDRSDERLTAGIREAAALEGLAPRSGPSRGDVGLNLIEKLKGWQEGLKQRKGLTGLAARNPGLTLGAGAMLAPGLLRLLGKGAEGLGDALTGDGAEQRLEDENKQRAVVLGQQLRMKRLQRDTQENMARIMSMQPEVAQQLMAGRRLPKGAVVLGGQPRQDLLQEMAQRMSRDEGEGGGDGGFA